MKVVLVIVGWCFGVGFCMVEEIAVDRTIHFFAHTFSDEVVQEGLFSWLIWVGRFG